MENGLIRRHLNKLLRVLTDILYFYVNLQLKKTTLGEKFRVRSGVATK
jgi:hypothetical protein